MAAEDREASRMMFDEDDSSLYSIDDDSLISENELNLSSQITRKLRPSTTIKLQNIITPKKPRQRNTTSNLALVIDSNEPSVEDHSNLKLEGCSLPRPGQKMSSPNLLKSLPTMYGKCK